MSIPNTYNPSDYQYLLRSLTEGSPIAKAESLKRFQVLANSDKKQFAVYAKRIILGLQDLPTQPKEQINLHATTLIIQIINLNPKDIEYYIRTKILRRIVSNLGDSKPQVRKTSHYCILAYIKTFKNIDQIILLYLDNGITSPEPQLRQKAINSFQSIIITDPKCLKWDSVEFKKLFQQLLYKLKDQSPFVQKASEQCLLTFSRMEEVHIFSKKLQPSVAGLYRIFTDTQRELGNLQSLNIQQNRRSQPQKNIGQSAPSETSKSNKNFKPTHTQLQKLSKQESINKQALIERIQEIRRNSQTPRIELSIKQTQPKEIKEVPKQRIRISASQSQKEIRSIEKLKQISPKKEPHMQISKLHTAIFVSKTENIQNVFGKKLFQDLKNQRDWKVRLSAIEELETKFQIYKEAIEIDVLTKTLFPTLLKLLTDQNFKIASITLKVFQEFLRTQGINLEIIAPQIVEKLGDGKVVLRQGVARLIRSQYLRLYNPIWIDSLLQLIKKATNPVIKEEVLGILKRMYEDEVIKYPLQNIVNDISPLMDDPKTKIKIKTLDLLVQIASSTHKIDILKNLLSTRLNQVYYEMFVEKVTMEMKHRVTPRLTESEPPAPGESRSLSFPSLRKNKNSANNTTTSSLQKYAKTVENRSITRVTRGVSDFSQKDDISITGPEKISQFQSFQEKPRGSFTPLDTIRKKPVKNVKRRIQKTFESKLIVNQTMQSDGLRPFSDPEKELRSVTNELKSEDWQNSFDALTKLRRLLKFHPQVITPAQGRLLTVQTAKLVESLRSSLSKNAVIALGQCVHIFGRSIDPQLQSIISRLMRKTLDANSFISQQVRKTLILLCVSCNQNKVVSILQNYHSSRAIPIKVNITYVLEELTSKPKAIEREIERIVSILVNLMGQGAIQIRERTKNILCKLIDEDKSGKIVKLVPASVLDKIKRRQMSQSFKIVKEKPQQPKQEPQMVSEMSIKQKSVSKREELNPIKRKKLIVFPNEFEELEELLQSCQTTDWKIRQSALTKIAEITKKYPSEISQYKLSTRIVEIFAKLSNDPNGKVATNALTLFTQIVPLMPRLIQSNLTVLTNEVFNCFASHKAQVRELSLHLFDSIASKIQHWMLVQHLCSGALYGPAKGKGNVLVKLIKVLPEAFNQKKTAVEKHVYSLINKLSEQQKGDLTPILKQLINMVISLGGQEVYSALKQQVKNLISI